MPVPSVNNQAATQLACCVQSVAERADDEDELLETDEEDEELDDEDLEDDEDEDDDDDDEDEDDELETLFGRISNPITPHGSLAVEIVPPVTVPGLAVGVHVCNPMPVSGVVADCTYSATASVQSPPDSPVAESWALSSACHTHATARAPVTVVVTVGIAGSVAWDKWAKLAEGTTSVIVPDTRPLKL